MLRGYHLGCPVWGHKDWVGRYFAAGSQPDAFLRQYASVFNAVEGNATFYGLPRATTVERWAQDTPGTFRFCFKFPQTITHDRRLVGAAAETAAFLALLRPLGPRLGPLMLQLPPGFGPDDLPQLAHFLRDLPRDLAYAVELRHPAYFSGGDAEAGLDDLLAGLAMDRVIFDSRGLWDSDRSDPLVRAAQARKPRLPVRLTVTGRSPVVRFVAHAHMDANRWLLKAWADQLALWIGQGLEPFVFVHAPDEGLAPQLARQLHEQLSRRVDAGLLPPWPADALPAVRQLGLF